MRRLFVAATLFMVLLAGCTPLPGSSPGSTAAPMPDIKAMRLASGLPDCPELAAAEAVTHGLPELALPCLGSDRSLRLSDLRGPAVINVWAQWCRPCRVEAPFFAAFAREAQGKVAVYGINSDDPRPDLAIQFATISEWTYPQLVDEDRKLAAALGHTGIPVTILLAADGTIMHTHMGELASYEELHGLVAHYLGVSV